MFLSLYVVNHSDRYFVKLEATAAEAQRQLQAAKDEADATHTADSCLMDNTTPTSLCVKCCLPVNLS